MSSDENICQEDKTVGSLSVSPSAVRIRFWCLKAAYQSHGDELKYRNVDYVENVTNDGRDDAVQNRSDKSEARGGIMVVIDVKCG